MVSLAFHVGKEENILIIIIGKIVNNAEKYERKVSTC